MIKYRAEARVSRLGQDVLDRLSTITGSHIEDDHLSDLEAAIAAYFSLKAVDGKLPPSLIEQYLVRLNNSHSKVADIVGDKLPEEIEAELSIGFSESVKRNQFHIDRALRFIRVGKSGRRTDHALVFLVFELSELYDQLTGETEQLVKNKVDFIDVCLRGIGIELSTSQIRHRYRESQEQGVEITRTP